MVGNWHWEDQWPFLCWEEEGQGQCWGQDLGWVIWGYRAPRLGHLLYPGGKGV